jgi:hypothetical protein
VQFQDRWFGFNQAALNANPQFIASVIQLPEIQERLQIWLRTTTAENQEAIIYYDGVILVEGAWPVDRPPQFTDKDGSEGIWGGRPFTNLARNAQFQHAWPYIEPKLFQIVSSKIQDLNPIHISSIMSLFLDIPGTKWYSETTGDVVFHTFWAKFGWGQVPLLSNPTWLHPYYILLFITLLGIFGAVFTGSELVKLRKNEFGFLFIIIILTVLITLFMGVYHESALRYKLVPTALHLSTTIPVPFLL